MRLSSDRLQKTRGAGGLGRLRLMPYMQVQLSCMLSDFLRLRTRAGLAQAHGIGDSVDVVRFVSRGDVIKNFAFHGRAGDCGRSKARKCFSKSLCVEVSASKHCSYGGFSGTRAFRMECPSTHLRVDEGYSQTVPTKSQP